MWAQVDPRQLATADGYRANPQAGWQWTEARRALMSRVQPNPGHYAIVDLERLLPTVTVLTQNIDGLHQVAGSKDVIELHGSIHKHKCFANCQGNPTPLAIDTLPAPESGGPPLCPHCGA